MPVMDSLAYTVKSNKQSLQSPLLTLKYITTNFWDSNNGLRKRCWHIEGCPNKTSLLSINILQPIILIKMRALFASQSGTKMLLLSRTSKYYLNRDQLRILTFQLMLNSDNYWVSEIAASQCSNLKNFTKYRTRGSCNNHILLISHKETKQLSCILVLYNLNHLKSKFLIHQDSRSTTIKSWKVVWQREKMQAHVYFHRQLKCRI